MRCARPSPAIAECYTPSSSRRSRSSSTSVNVARRAALRIWTDHGGDRGDARVLKMSLAGTVARAASGGHRPL